MDDPPLTPTDAAALDAAEAAHASTLADIEAASAPALLRWLTETRCE
jgi:hypothetical protein